jgi:hypothetical protein
MVLDGPDGAQDAACPADMMSTEGSEATFDRDIPMLRSIFDVAGSAQLYVISQQRRGFYQTAKELGCLHERSDV